jgi:hypothetical protein
MLNVVDSVFSVDHQTLGSLGRATIRALSLAFRISEPEYHHSAELGIKGSSSQRLCDITASLSGSIYLTGHGALKYLNHTIFEDRGIDVRYMNYCVGPWDQLHGDFTPYVTGLDVLAHLGPNAATALNSTTLNWREALEQPDSLRQ